MPTVWSRISAFEARYGFRFSTKKKRRIADILKAVYKKNDNPPISYVPSPEPGANYNVRNYPDKFQKTMDAIVIKVYQQHRDNVLLNERAVKRKNVPRETMRSVKARKRIPLNGPIRSVKPKNNNNV